VDFRARLVDGSFHTVDSSRHGFRIPESMALKERAGQRPSLLLEPMMRLEVIVADEMLGEVNRRPHFEARQDLRDGAPLPRGR